MVHQYEEPGTDQQLLGICDSGHRGAVFADPVQDLCGEHSGVPGGIRGHGRRRLSGQIHQDHNAAEQTDFGHYGDLFCRGAVELLYGHAVFDDGFL